MTVKLRVYGGQIVEREVLEDDGMRVIVTTREEKARAAEEGREPMCLSFPAADVVERVVGRGLKERPT